MTFNESVMILYRGVFAGFTGYVPKARFLIGSSYPKTTNKALIQLGKQMKASHSAHGLTTESADNLVSLPSIYPTQQGLLPRYTGHVPGTDCFLLRNMQGQRAVANIIIQNVDQTLISFNLNLYRKIAWTSDLNNNIMTWF